MTLTTDKYLINIRPLQLILILVVLQLLIVFLTSYQGLSFDEAIWHYIGRNWFRHGLVPYKGGVDNKSPLIYMIYGFSDFLFGINYWFTRLLAIGCQFTGVYFVYRIAKYVSGKQAGIIAILLYGLSLTWKSTDGKMVSFTQTYEITFLLMSFYFFLIAPNKKQLFISGLLGGIAVGFRFSAAFAMAAMLLTLLFQKRSFSAAMIFLSGIVSMAILLLILFSLLGINLNEFFIYSFSDNFAAGSVRDHSFSWKLEEFENCFFYSEIILFYPFILAFLFINRTPVIFILWLAASFTGITVIGMFARNHLKELLPPLSIMSALSINHLLDSNKIPAKATFFILLFSFFPKTFEPFFGFKGLFSSKNNLPAPACNLPYQDDESLKKALGLWIKTNSLPEEKVYIAGYSAQAQAYSERLSPSVYFNITQTVFARSRLFADLSSNAAALVAIPLFPKYNLIDPRIRSYVHEFVEKNYYLDTCLYSYNIYRHHKTIYP